MARLLFKDGVRINSEHFRAEIARIIPAISATAPATIGDVVVISSANDGKHKEGSLHYTDAAFDCRVVASDHDISGCVIAETVEESVRIAEKWRDDIKKRLGKKDYDVIVEKKSTSDGRVIVHIHVEYDPE